MTKHEGMDQLNDLMKYGSSDSPQDLGGTMITGDSIRTRSTNRVSWMIWTRFPMMSTGSSFPAEVLHSTKIRLLCQVYDNK